MPVFEKIVTKDQHIPVLLREIFSQFTVNEPPHHLQNRLLEKKSETRILDLTAGRGGHAGAMMEAYPNAHFFLNDQDADAIDFLRQKFASQIAEKKVSLLHSNFLNFDFKENFDLILVDLGVSSPQLDQGDRGFSFYLDGPLDMRMDQRSSRTAADLLNTYDENELVHLFRLYGEIQKPHRVVRAIVQDREKQVWTSTRALAGLIERVDGWRKKGQHPATLYFQALRLAVNQELEVLSETLPKILQALRPNGRLAVLTFHSLEDRIVKQVLRSSSLGTCVNRKVITALDDELKTNPRSRSAKLRVWEANSAEVPT